MISVAVRVQLEICVHHIFLGLYCTNDNFIVEDVHKSFIKMGVNKLGININKLKQQAYEDSQDKGVANIYLTYHTPEDTINGIATINKYIMDGGLYVNKE